MTTKLQENDPLVRAFCRAVQERREFLRISQEEVAHRAGLHRTYISDIERGSRNISLKNLCRLALALELPVSSLLRAAEMKLSNAGEGGNGPGMTDNLERRSGPQKRFRANRTRKGES